MPNPLNERFRELRQRSGLDENQAGELMKTNVWDIEGHEDELEMVYSVDDIRRFCRVMGATTRELFQIETAESPVSADELVRLIHEQCRTRQITLEQFENIVGWRLSACINPPEALLCDLTVDSLQWLCTELRIHWHRVMLGL